MPRMLENIGRHMEMGNPPKRRRTTVRARSAHDPLLRSRSPRLPGALHAGILCGSFTSSRSPSARDPDLGRGLLSLTPRLCSRSCGPPPRPITPASTRAPARLRRMLRVTSGGLAADCATAPRRRLLLVLALMGRVFGAPDGFSDEDQGATSRSPKRRRACPFRSDVAPQRAAEITARSAQALFLEHLRSKPARSRPRHRAHLRPSGAARRASRSARDHRPVASTPGRAARAACLLQDLPSTASAASSRRALPFHAADPDTSSSIAPRPPRDPLARFPICVTSRRTGRRRIRRSSRHRPRQGRHARRHRRSRSRGHSTARTATDGSRDLRAGRPVQVIRISRTLPRDRRRSRSSTSFLEGSFVPLNAVMRPRRASAADRESRRTVAA